MKMIYYQFLYVILNIASACCLTCNEVLEISEKLSLDDLQTIRPKEMLKCLPHLAREPLGLQEAEFIWQTIIHHYDGVPNVPSKVLKLLHWVTTAVTPEDIYNMTFSDIEIVQNFGLNYNLDEAQLNAIADRVREDFSGKEPEDYSYYDLIALRQILCAFNRSEIARIHPAAYREAALQVGKLKNCNSDVMLEFATLAIQPSAFGNPENWAQTIITILGAVAKYLPKEMTQKFHVNTTKVQD